MTIWAIVPAAGIGRRMGSIQSNSLPKQYAPLLGKPVLEHALERLLAVTAIEKLVVVLHPEDRHFKTLAVADDERVVTARGGGERQQSVLNGLAALVEAREEDWVLVHDAVRPCVLSADVVRLIDSLMNHPVGGLLGAPLDNTLKLVDEQGEVAGTADRSRYWHAFTPQLFRFGLLRRALESGRDSGQSLTDEASAIEALGERPRMLASSKHNIKITHADDLALAENLLALQANTARERHL